MNGSTNIHCTEINITSPWQNRGNNTTTLQKTTHDLGVVNVLLRKITNKRDWYCQFISRWIMTQLIKNIQNQDFKRSKNTLNPWFIKHEKVPYRYLTRSARRMEQYVILFSGPYCSYYSPKVYYQLKKKIRADLIWQTWKGMFFPKLSVLEI